LGWKVKVISILPNLLENSIRAIAKRLQFVMTLGLKTLAFHVKPDFITKSKKHRGMVRIMVGFVALLGWFTNLGMFMR
jgi:hypothetical protein